MPCSPSAPNLGHRSRGNWLLLSISSARGAISWLEKSRTVSRIASAVSPRSKLNIRCALGIMVEAASFRSARAARRSVVWQQPCHGWRDLRREWAAYFALRYSVMIRRHPRKRTPLPSRPQRDVIRTNMRFRNQPPKPQSGRAAMHGTLDVARDDAQTAARERAYGIPLDKFDPGDPELFRDDTFWPYFERLRKEDPIHYCKDSVFGPYWSVTKYNDIMKVETNHQVYSSAAVFGGITIRDAGVDYRRPSFIAMDQPTHSGQRKTVAPMFTPTHLDQLAATIRERAGQVLDALPRNETFDWVDRVSIELTTQMLATLFDFPWEDRRKLTRWSDLATALPKTEAAEQKRQAELIACGDYFATLWKERMNAPPKSDLLSMMAHSEATRDLVSQNFLGNIILLIVGGNDTTRNSLSGGVFALN